MLVAAHVNDLRAAQRAGLHAAYVPRPLEFDPANPSADPPDPAFDCVAEDFVDLANKLGA
jgi:2-haloacid dehalogenase